MTNLVTYEELLTGADAEVAAGLGVVFSESMEEMMNRVVQAQNSVAALSLAAGYLLLKVKTETEHGGFDAKLQSFGISRQSASELMRTAKFYTTLPVDKRSQVFRLGKSKMQMLAKAEFEVIEDILDDPEAGIGELSVREMRKLIQQLEGKLANSNAALETANNQIKAIKSKEHITRFEFETEAIREECLHMQAGCELHINALQKLFEVATNSGETSEKSLRVEHVYIAAIVAASRALDLVERMRESGYNLPERVLGQHILTPEEAARWVHDYPMILNAHGSKQVLREVDRENARDGKRGRKIGSKNRAAQ